MPKAVFRKISHGKLRKLGLNILCFSSCILGFGTKAGKLLRCIDGSKSKLQVRRQGIYSRSFHIGTLPFFLPSASPNLPGRPSSRQDVIIDG